MSEEQKKQIKSIHFKTKSLQPPEEDIKLEQHFKEKFTEEEKVAPKPGKGGYRFPKDDPATKIHRSIVWTIVKEVGNRLLEGQDLISTPLPVIIFEKRSLLERICDHWCRIDLLSKAAKSKDPLERFNLTIAFMVAGLHKTCCALKPFNPILGETFQAIYDDGSAVYCEQTSHHPPVSHFTVEGNGFKLYGTCIPSASIRGNSLKAHETGKYFVEFEDGTKISFELPYVYVNGMWWGERVMNYFGKPVFIDEKNKLLCKLIFDPDKKSFFKMFATKKTPSDWIRGEVLVTNDKKATPVGIIEGSWLSSLSFTDANTKQSTVLWDIKEGNDVSPKPIDDPLPSDCRFREDLIALRKDELENASKWKVKLEQKQRKEAKWRRGL